MSFSTLDISEFVLIVLFVISVVHHAHIILYLKYQTEIPNCKQPVSFWCSSNKRWNFYWYSTTTKFFHQNVSNRHIPEWFCIGGDHFEKAHKYPWELPAFLHCLLFFLENLPAKISLPLGRRRYCRQLILVLL